MSKKKDVKSLRETHPELAKEWDNEKNGTLTPDNITAGSHKKVWWRKECEQPSTGEKVTLRWKAAIENRVKGSGCPYLSGSAVWQGFNDLATTNPDLAKEWNPTKNGDLKPEDVTAGSQKKVWWRMPYDDPITGKHFDFEWKAAVSNRTKGSGCPFLSGSAVWQGFNDLATTNPDLAKEWNPTKNGDLKPEDVTAGSSRKVWWCLNYAETETSKRVVYEWCASIHSRVRGAGCPFIKKKRT